MPHRIRLVRIGPERVREGDGRGGAGAHRRRPRAAPVKKPAASGGSYFATATDFSGAACANAGRSVIPELFDHAVGEQFQVVEVGLIQHLQINPLHSGLAEGASLSTISAGVPTSGVLVSQLVDLPADLRGASRDFGVVPARAHHETCGVRHRVGRPTCSATAVATRSNCALITSSATNGTLNSVAKRAASAGCLLGAGAADDDRRARLLCGFGERR